MKEDLIYLLGFKDAKYTAEKELEKNPCAVNAQKVFEYSKRIDGVLAKIDKDYDELNKYKELEKVLGCPLDVFAKLTLTQRIWAESEEMHFISDNFGKFVDSSKWEDRFWCHVDTDFNVDEDNFGETEFWAWYHYDGNGSDHIILKLNEYGTKWWLKADKSE